VCSILGAFGVQEQDWNRSRKCNSRSHNIRKRYLVVSRRTTGLRVYGIVELFNNAGRNGEQRRGGNLDEICVTLNKNVEHEIVLDKFV
jgi:hypothetical protein